MKTSSEWKGCQYYESLTLRPKLLVATLWKRLTAECSVGVQANSSSALTVRYKKVQVEGMGKCCPEGYSLAVAWSVHFRK